MFQINPNCKDNNIFVEYNIILKHKKVAYVCVCPLKLLFLHFIGCLLCWLDKSH